jgi:hypothetical protein
VGEAGVLGELDFFGVDHEEFDFARGGVHEDGHDDGVDADRFTRSGGTGNEKVRRTGQIGDDRFAADPFPKEEGDLEFFRFLLVMEEEFFEADGLGMEGGNFDADSGFARDGGDDSDRLGLHVEGDVVFKGFDFLNFDADGGVDLKGGDGGAAVDFTDFGIDAEAF